MKRAEAAKISLGWGHQASALASPSESLKAACPHAVFLQISNFSRCSPKGGLNSIFMNVEKVFLKAEWRYLAMLNYEIDPAVLAPRVPTGTELDKWNDKTFVSIVGFLFLKTKVLGIPVPLHQDFEEVNLRFYVRRCVEEEWRRGVVFVKEIVPRWAIAAMARKCYGENYVALPMHHQITLRDGQLATEASVEYSWRMAGKWDRLGVRMSGEPSVVRPGSEEEFITEHYWGYSVQPGGDCVEYRVEHPSWRVWQVAQAALECEVEKLYGEEFCQSLNSEPSSAFLAEGSAVSVYRGRSL